MGNKVKDAKFMLNVIEGTIIQLEKRRAELSAQADPETGELPLEVQKEIGKITQNLRLIRSMKKDFQENLEKARNEEEKKRIVSSMALAMLIGAVNENYRLSLEAEKEDAMERGFSETVADALFSSVDFRYVNKDEIQDILDDQEFHIMASEDPGRLQREELDVREEYEEMMKKEMNLAGIAPGENFEQNEERFREYLKRNNGFEFVLKRNAQYIEEYILPENSNLGTAEDKKHFSEVLEEIRELGSITRKYQEQFILNDDSFEKGNEFTMELVEREKALGDKIEAYSSKMLSELLELKPEDNRYRDCSILYQKSQMLLTPIRNQQQRDYAFARNNDLRRRMERWSIYQQLPGEGRPSVIRESVEIQNRKKAVAKLQRMERTAIRRELTDNEEVSDAEISKAKAYIREGKGDMRASITAWAVEETQNLLDRLENGEVIGEKEVPELRKALAGVVLFQVMMEEMQRDDGEPRLFFDTLCYGFSQQKFRAIAKDLSETEVFRKSVNSLIREDNITEDIYRFLANDFEKDISKKVLSACTGKKKEKKPVPKKDIKKQKNVKKDKNASKDIPKDTTGKQHQGHRS